MSVELDGLHLHNYEGGCTDQCVYQYPTGGRCFQSELAHAMAREIVALRGDVERVTEEREVFRGAAHDFERAHDEAERALAELRGKVEALVSEMTLPAPGYAGQVCRRWADRIAAILSEPKP